MPEFVINLCTEPGDIVLEPFAGSNMTGRVAETLQRRWLAFEIDEDYIRSSKLRFEENAPLVVEPPADLTTVTPENSEQNDQILQLGLL
ncbi:hypothetical protein NUACC21_06990 [Scytonema sp. NUACC21]